MNMIKEMDKYGGYYYEFSFEERKFQVEIQVEEIPDLEAYSSAFRDDAFFMQAKAGNDINTIPPETQWLAVKHTDGSFSAYFSIVDEYFRTCMYGNNGHLCISAITGDNATTGNRFCGLYRIDGNDFYALVETAARSLSERYPHVVLRETKKDPDFMKYLGWCTWDSFYDAVSEEKVIEGLESFQKGGFVPKFFLLDDGWQDVEVWGNCRGEWKLTSFRANKKFGGSLKNLVDTAKQKYGVEKFFVWHAVMGYWGGVSMTAPEMQKYRPVMSVAIHTDGMKKNVPARWESEQFPFGLIDSDKAFEFYNDYHFYLKNEGVDGVKIDVQAALEAHGIGHGGRTNLVRKMRAGLEASVAYNFDSDMINCMSSSNDIIYNSKRTNMMRSSGDFWPPAPTSGHVSHVYFNAVNSIWMGLFTNCDWDMFHTLNPHGAYHAAARAISGGPVYISDRVDEHDFDLIRQLVTSDGCILKAEGIARPTVDCLFDDVTKGEKAYKIFNTNQYSGVVGVFASADEGCQMAEVKVSDINGWGKGNYVCHSYKTQNNICLTEADTVPVEVKEREFDILTFAEIKNGFAFIGLVDKMNSGAAVEKVTYIPDGVCVEVVDGGRFLFYSEKEISKLYVNGEETEVCAKGNFVEICLKEKASVIIR